MSAMYGTNACFLNKSPKMMCLAKKGKEKKRKRKKPENDQTDTFEPFCPSGAQLGSQGERGSQRVRNVARDVSAYHPPITLLAICMALSYRPHLTASARPRPPHTFRHTDLAS